MIRDVCGWTQYRRSISKMELRRGLEEARGWTNSNVLETANTCARRILPTSFFARVQEMAHGG